MFIRVKTTPNSPRKSIQIVGNYRVGNVVKQKILRYVGIAMDESEEQKLKALATEIIAKLIKEQGNPSKQMSLIDIDTDEFNQQLRAISDKKKGRPLRKKIEDIIPPKQVTLDMIVEKTRIVEGVHEIAGKMYDDIGYGSMLKSKRDKEMLRDLVMARLVAPASKHKTRDFLLKRFDKIHDLDAIYRLMDKIHEAVDEMKKITFLKTKKLFPQGVDLVLFDVTTLYFESTTTDDLRGFGYSKDHRFNTTQVVLALATNIDGLPIRYELFEGNKAEVNTLIASIEHWKTLFDIGTVCFIGDRAMFSKKNIQLITERNYKYIIAAKVRGLSEKNYKISIMSDQLTWIGEFDYFVK